MAGIITLPGGPYQANGRPNTKRSNAKSVWELAEPLGARIRALIRDCPYKGELELVSGLRDPGRQWDLRFERVGLKNIWNNAIQGAITTAVPARWNEVLEKWVGGSRHQHGDAADLGGTYRAMEWARANREAYGLALTVPREGWHFEADRWDIHTGRIHNKPTANIHEPTKKGLFMHLTEAQEKAMYDKVMSTDDTVGRIKSDTQVIRSWVNQILNILVGKGARSNVLKTIAGSMKRLEAKVRR